MILIEVKLDLSVLSAKLIFKAKKSLKEVSFTFSYLRLIRA
jgi:hypothetical protein